jgi:transposase
MAKPLSPDLRLRIIRAVEDEGMSCRGAAGRFGVAPSTAIELVSEWRSTGACDAGAQTGVQPGTGRQPKVSRVLQQFRSVRNSRTEMSGDWKTLREASTA